ncbi:MAG TPA: hypothetical protein VGN81_19255 [Pseudonocardiaceae bacterium]|jgi:hypothetical protein
MDPALPRRCHDALEPIAAAIFAAPELQEHLTAAGLDRGRMCAYAGRAAPLGRAGAGLVMATFYTAGPGLIARFFPRAWTLADPADVIAAQRTAVDVLLRRVLGPEIIESAELAELAKLARIAAESGTVEGRPMYAACAELDWPTEPHVALWHAAILLREHRGDGHVTALVDAELSGLAAIITHAGAGTGYTSDLLRRIRGWTEQEWAAGVADLQANGIVDGSGALTATGTALRQRVEATTDRLAAAPWAALGAERIERLLALTAAVRAVVLAAGLLPPGLY